MYLIYHLGIDLQLVDEDALVTGAEELLSGCQQSANDFLNLKTEAKQTKRQISWP
jgi:hypothetical protein